MMKNKKPVIRFKGFSEEWEEKELKDIAIVKTGYPFDSKDFDNDGEYLVITNGNIQNDLPYVDSSLGNKIDFNNSFSLNEYLLNQNDILVTMDGTVGRTAKVVEQKQILAQRVGRLIAKIEADFLYQFLNTGAFFKEMSLIAHGGTIKHISLNEIGSYESFIPFQFQEQTQIGNFFKNLDNLITLHQRKYEKLGVLKKAMLEKMFPKNGANVPEIRFKGFTGAWEEKKLGEMCVIGDIDHRMPESVKDGIPYIMTGSFVGINDIDFEDSKLISIEDYEQLSKKIKPELGDILFARYASVGAVRYVETRMKFLVSYSCAILKNNPTFNSKYAFYYLQSQEAQYQIELEINTGSQRNIGIDSLKKLTFFLPQREEQEKIGTYFKNLDDLLRLHDKELEKIKNLKKALLEKMFV